MRKAFVKTGLAAAAMLALSATSGWAISPSAMPAATNLYTCSGRSLSRVALATQLEQPAPCCTGLTGCPQLLANTGLVKPRRDNRT